MQIIYAILNAHKRNVALCIYINAFESLSMPRALFKLQYVEFVFFC